MLKLSTKGRYAARIMVRLTMHNTGKPARKQEIATAEGISADYVEQILMKLKTAGLVQSHRGARGGFSLACDPQKTDVAAILRATEGPVALAPCSDGRCERATTCVTRPIWDEAAKALEAVFTNANLGELAENARLLRASAEPDYNI